MNVYKVNIAYWEGIVIAESEEMAIGIVKDSGVFHTAPDSSFTVKELKRDFPGIVHYHLYNY